MYLSRELTDQTLPAIGRAFGGRNHTTVMHACRRTAERIATDREAYDTVRRLTDELSARPMSPRRLTDCSVHAQPPVRAPAAAQRHPRELCTASTAPMTMNLSLDHLS